MEWFGIRSVFHFGVNSLGVNIFEERVVVFEAASLDEAHRKAEIEAEKYAVENGFTMHSEQVGYKQDGEPLIEGYEVWSELFESEVNLDQFYKVRYENFIYHPENA